MKIAHNSHLKIIETLEEENRFKRWRIVREQEKERDERERSLCLGMQYTNTRCGQPLNDLVLFSLNNRIE